jgi:hypothetical protein
VAGGLFATSPLGSRAGGGAAAGPASCTVEARPSWPAPAGTTPALRPATRLMLARPPATTASAIEDASVIEVARRWALASVAPAGAAGSAREAPREVKPPRPTARPRATAPALRPPRALREDLYDMR